MQLIPKFETLAYLNGTWVPIVVPSNLPAVRVVIMNMSTAGSTVEVLLRTTQGDAGSEIPLSLDSQHPLGFPAAAASGVGRVAAFNPGQVLCWITGVSGAGSVKLDWLLVQN